MHKKNPRGEARAWDSVVGVTVVTLFDTSARNGCFEMRPNPIAERAAGIDAKRADLCRRLAGRRALAPFGPGLLIGGDRTLPSWCVFLLPLLHQRTINGFNVHNVVRRVTGRQGERTIDPFCAAGAERLSFPREQLRFDTRFEQREDEINLSLVDLNRYLDLFHGFFLQTEAAHLLAR